MCPFELISTTDPIQEMILNIKSVQFLLEGSTTTNTCTEYACSVRSFQRQRTFVNELNQTYSTAGFELILERNFLKYIISYYMKSGLLVASSWISFVIPPDVIPGRMALLITLLLALINLSGTVIDKRPSTKNTTILEIWMFICTSYVWAALVPSSFTSLCFFRPKRTFKSPKFKILQ